MVERTIGYVLEWGWWSCIAWTYDLKTKLAEVSYPVGSQGPCDAEPVRSCIAAEIRRLAVAALMAPALLGNEDHRATCAAVASSQGGL